MAMNRFKGIQKKTAQVNTITIGGTPAAGQVYSVTFNQKIVSYTAIVTDTNALITAALFDALQACTEPEFKEATWDDPTATTITGTATKAGRPFTQSSAATGTGTCVTATTTANTSPNDVNDPVNWSAGHVPANGDDLYWDNTSVDSLWNLDQFTTVTPASITVAMSFSASAPGGGQGTVGLPEINVSSTPYAEYRPQYLQFNGVTGGVVLIGNGAGTGSGRLMFDFLTGAVQAVVINTGSPTDQQLPALILKGTNSANLLDVQGGSVGVAIFGGETSSFTNSGSTSSPGIKVGSGGNGAQPPTVTLGAGVTWSSISQTGGTLTMQSGGTTFTQSGGTAALVATVGSITTATIAGQFTYQGAGTIGTLNVQNGGQVDFSVDPRPRTVTACNVSGGHRINDKGKTVSWTTTIAGVNGVDPAADGTLILGKGRALAVSG